MLTERMRRHLIPIATIVTLAVVIGGVGIDYATADDDTRSLCAEFSDASGLYEGNSVAMLGKKVGRVVGIHEEGQKGVRVDMRIDKTVPLPADVGATLVSTSIVTERQIEFTHPYRGGEYYKSAECIPLEKTRTPLGISQTLDAISTLSDELVKDDGRNTDAILQALTLVSKNMEGTQGDISGILQDSATLINDPTRRDSQIRRIVANLATLTGVATENSTEVTQLFDNFVGAIEVIVAFGQTFGAATEYAGTFVPILSRLSSAFGPPIFSLGDAAVPLLSQAGKQENILASVAARTADLIVEHPDAKSILRAFAISVPLQALKNACAPPSVKDVCATGNEAATIANLIGGQPR